ncbi:hypothetical protein HQ560_00195, partial [bacterium]|nr:hypothetical protein [bacterium]
MSIERAKFMNSTLSLLLCVLAVAASSSSAEEPKKVVGDLDGQIICTGAGRVVKLGKDGNELWSYKGQNVSDVWLLPNGNILFADNNA